MLFVKIFSSLCVVYILNLSPQSLVKGELLTLKLMINYFYEQALGVERVNGSYRQNQRDEGVGSVCNSLENFVKYVI